MQDCGNELDTTQGSVLSVILFVGILVTKAKKQLMTSSRGLVL